MALNLLNRKFRYTNTNATLKLVIINVLVFLMTSFSYRLVYILSLVPAYIIYNKWYWQVFTYMFVHGGFSHLLFNMFGLYIFGRAIERSLGTREFLLFYFVTGSLSGIFSLFAYILSGTNVILMGASGAIYAILLAFATLYPHSTIFVFGLIPMRAPVMVILYAFLEISNQIRGSSAGVAHLTHLAGFAFAYLYFVVRLKINPIKSWRRTL
ncbi:MAG: rhomboid family intramembrane serine protease [Sphaerochaetaceae bacterium]